MRKAALVGAALLAAATAASSAVAAPSRHGVALSSLEQGVLTDINAFRAAHHLSPLRLSASLTAAARSHSLQMEADGYFAHDSFDGTAFWKRIQAFYPSSHSRYWSVGENLLWSSPSVDPQKALAMWEASPEHLRNMLDPSWREIGVSAVHAPQAPGVYQGLAVTIVTTDFGVRR
ncbi:MAG: CAP domain-containing protein [Acidobacteriota bacterium]|nr:CAP domain-containing protein [Acidobacteriota bacterium]